MNARTTIANLLWAASNLPCWAAFRRALRDPVAAQDAVLRGIVGRAARTAFGQAHAFDRIHSQADFAARVPVRDYADLEPWIVRVQRGETNVLTGEPVKRLATTGGTTGPRKLIPYTSGLQGEFNRAIGPWIVDLFRQFPSLVGGPAYWSISPVARTAPEPSAVPIGFEEDSEYLGGIRRHLVDAVMAVPAEVRRAATVEEWRRLTLQHLCHRADLRLISVWHPSFLTLLLDRLAGDAAQRWPRLKVISCWADGYATASAAALAEQFPRAVVQPKGVIATEAIVSVPFAGRWPLAVRSHFFEFIDDHGNAHTTGELQAGATYEVVVTTGGGLYRYKLNDLVIVEGFLGRTPSIRFVSKAGHISDRFGEKLSEAFVGQVLGRLQADGGVRWRFAMLAPESDHYVLFVEGDAPDDLRARLDAELRRNAQYAYCRDLGQLGPPGVLKIREGGYARFVTRLLTSGQRLGDIKPAALSSMDGWRAHFERDSSAVSPNGVE